MMVFVFREDILGQRFENDAWLGMRCQLFFFRFNLWLVQIYFYLILFAENLLL